MEKNLHQSAALLMGIMIVAIVSLVVVTFAKNTLQTLVAGTHITDWEIAHQAAETGLENALLHLKTGGGVYPTGSTDSSTLFKRRDMDLVGIDDNIYDSDLNAAPANPAHQYWNLKIWQPPAEAVPGDPSSYNFCTSSNLRGSDYGIPQYAFITHCVNSAPLAAPQQYLVNGTYYSISAQNNWTVTVYPPPYELNFQATVTGWYWIWADFSPGVTLEPNCYGSGEGGPKLGDYCVPRHPLGTPDLTVTALTGTVTYNREDVQGLSGMTVRFYLHYAYAFNYTIDSCQYRPTLFSPWQPCELGGVSLVSSVQSLGYVARQSYFGGATYYYIDAVGMFGNNRVKIRAVVDIADPNNPRVYRLPFY